MLAQILRLTMFAAIAMWVRRRWKRLGACAAAILAAVYAHGEFLHFVAALPAGSEQVLTAGEYVPLSFVLKHTVIVGALFAYLMLEVRAWRRKADRRARAITPRQTTPGTSSTSAESCPDGALSPQDTGSADDGFDFLRHDRALENRAQKVIKSKPER